jgi:hypothetical protein
MMKMIVGVIGGVLITAGILLLVLPGPGLLLIALGILVLASEFEWAKKIYNKFKAWLAKK